ncbi:glycosyltransferase family 4 protein [Muricauda sp. 2012CJ35-5]|uniref:Glycosyltransferase family 4 protein n=1 Tax=Flagellimonas spongiicola TaxID=2942208 RepID=A0ABT0PVX6_9FLAO|nr:glycosyltransferase family 4 protein [Allomuricauda spongiicola]MCL6275537.1 glycosyltransferase family 4 protein [Allomuricauda spongiicola]
MKKIVFLALNYSSATSEPGMYPDLMSKFLAKGHEVFVVAPALNDTDKISLNKEAGINVLRVPTLKLFGGGLIQKGISNILLPIQFKRAIKKSNIKLDFDLIIIPTPPITMISVAVWLKKRSKGKLYLILRDIFPQNGVDLKLMSNKGPAYRYFRNLEKKLYKHSDSIGCMSPANVDYVLEHNKEVNPDKLHLLPNWEPLKEAKEIVEGEEELRKRYGLQNKSVAIYGGNIGLPQQLENIIDLAESVQDIDDLVFLIIGWGTEKEKIMGLANDKKLTNVIFMDSVNRNELGKILKISDIGLISLNKDFTIPNYPSKVNSYYRYKIPVLSSLDANTDFGIIQDEIGCGFWSLAGDTKAMKDNLLKLYNSESLREEMGLKGYNHMKDNLTPKHAYETITKQFPS